MRVDPDTVVTIAEIAAEMGVREDTVRELLLDARAARREGRSTPGDLPLPYRYIGGMPVWMRADLDAWQRRRPGRPLGSRDRRKRQPRSDRGVPRYPAAWQHLRPSG